MTMSDWPTRTTTSFCGQLVLNSLLMIKHPRVRLCGLTAACTGDDLQCSTLSGGMRQATKEEGAGIEIIPGIASPDRLRNDTLVVGLGFF